MSARSYRSARNPRSGASPRRGRRGPFGSRWRLRCGGSSRSGLGIWCRCWRRGRFGGCRRWNGRLWRSLSGWRCHGRRCNGRFGYKRAGRLARRCVGLQPGLRGFLCGLLRCFGLSGEFSCRGLLAAGRACLRTPPALRRGNRRFVGRLRPCRTRRSLRALTLARVGFRRRTRISQQIRCQSAGRLDLARVVLAQKARQRADIARFCQAAGGFMANRAVARKKLRRGFTGRIVGLRICRGRCPNQTQDNDETAQQHLIPPINDEYGVHYCQKPVNISSKPDGTPTRTGVLRRSGIIQACTTEIAPIPGLWSNSVRGAIGDTKERLARWGGEANVGSGFAPAARTKVTMRRPVC